MYCSECGKVISDKSKFCRYCGAVIEPEEATPVNRSVGTVSEPKTPVSHTSVSVSNKPVTPPAKQEKKKEKWTFTDVIVLLIFVFVIVGISYSCGEGCNMASCLMSDTDKGSSSESLLPTAKSDYEAYKAVFEGTGVYHYTLNAGSDTKTVNYAMKDANGNVCCADYVHKDGVVQKYTETIYMFINGASDEDVAVWESNARQEFAKFEALDFVTVKYETTDIFLMIGITYDNLEEKENVEALMDAGFAVGDTDAETLSMAKCEETLIKEGFIKK